MISNLSFEKYYSDDSGIEHAVRYIERPFKTYDPVIEIESINKIQFPIDKIDWLIDSLKKIKSEISDI